MADVSTAAPTRVLKVPGLTQELEAREESADQMIATDGARVEASCCRMVPARSALTTLEAKLLPHNHPIYQQPVLRIDVKEAVQSFLPMVLVNDATPSTRY